MKNNKHKGKKQFGSNHSGENISLPDEFLHDFEKDFGKENREKYEQSFSQNNIRGLRVNTLKIDVEHFKNLFKLKLKPIQYFENAFILEDDEKLGNSILHQIGAYYLQEPSSMIPVASIKNYNFENKKILDLCASPGGKSTQIAELMKNTGLLVCNEIDKQRANVLLSNIERLGITNAVVTNESPQNLANNFTNFFDYILVDAPCSGEGMFRKDKTAIKEWNNNLKYFNHNRQMEILFYADKMLKIGGTIVYSTCTFNTVENEQTIAKFIQNNNYDIKLPSNDVLENTLPANQNVLKTDYPKARHFFPFFSAGEGQFVCVLNKVKGEEKSEKQQNRKYSYEVLKKDNNQKDYKLWEQIFDLTLDKNILKNGEYALIKNNEHFYLLKSDFNEENFRGLCLKSLGIYAGEIVNERVVLSHQFAKVFGQFFLNKVDFKIDSLILKKYFNGEQLDIEQIKLEDKFFNLSGNQNGYMCVLCEGICVGLGKVSNGKINNLYPKAFRLKL